jgi:hypothetical protein
MSLFPPPYHTVGKWCEHKESSNYCDSDSFTFCLSGGECNEFYP